jgi:2-dehydropantoate 2-reductase
MYEQARAEAITCLEVAGIDVATEDEDRARRGDLLMVQPVSGRLRDGGSSWQSLARGAGTIETDHLNGEIVLLGRLYGVPTPVNEALQRVANRMARERVSPGTLSPEDVLGVDPRARIRH